jgi:hypothetical protein
VQDADLEYAPEDYRAMLPLLDGEKVSVYGSRILGQFRAGHRFPLPGKHPEQGFGPYLANVVLSLWCFLLYGRWITDLLTAYKIYPTSAIRKMTVVTKGFETDHEITAKLIHQGLRIREVPIDYVPRSVEEGKKIKMTDGFIAVWTLFRFRWSS